MSEFTAEIDIPFVENTGRRCVPACTSMLLKTLMPSCLYTTKEVEHISGFREGYSTRAAQHLLSLSQLGIEVGWIQNEDLASFARDPDAYMREQILNVNDYESFCETNDVALEAQRVGEYLESGLSFENRPATKYDITTRMLGGWAVRLEVNGKTLANRKGYAAHAVVVSGFNDDVVRIEDPDGLFGSRPKQIVSWDELQEAWPDPTMQYYRCT